MKDAENERTLGTKKLRFVKKLVINLPFEEIC